MAKIQLSESNGQFIQEAGNKILLQITKSHYDQEFGKVEIELKNEKGEIINNNFGLMANDGSINEAALKAFSYFSRVAVRDWGRDDIEDEELVGKFIRADIKMVKGTKPNKDGNTIDFANIDKCYMINDDDVDYISDNGFDHIDKPTKKADKPKAATKAKAAPSKVEDDEDWD